MTEKYCGKDCDLCQEKSRLSCPGCEAGPGNPENGDCEIAHCCREKGWEKCEQCQQRLECHKLRNAQDMPEIIELRRKVEQRTQDEKKNRAEILGKWFWILFLLFIPGVIAGILGNENLVISVEIYRFGWILEMAVGIVYGVILIVLKPLESRYGIAGILQIAGVALSAAISFVSNTGTIFWYFGLSAVLSLLSLVGTYFEYYGHAAVLEAYDEGFSKKWKTLWKWYAGLYIFILVSPWIAVSGIVKIIFLGIFAAAIGVVVISIISLVYLYKMAKLFRNY